MSLVESCKTGDRAAQLRILREIIADAIDSCDSNRDLAALAHRFVEVSSEIEAMEQCDDELDEIAAIIARRTDGR